MTPEQAEVLGWFAEMLRSVTADGGRKRAAGLKPSWKVDQSHEAAIFSHINKWKHGEFVDKDSGQHPLVHAAWRCLAIAWIETNTLEDVRVAESPFTPALPAVSSKHDAVAEALDTPLCGKPGCDIPVHQRDAGPSVRW